MAEAKGTQKRIFLQLCETGSHWQRVLFNGLSFNRILCSYAYQTTKVARPFVVGTVLGPPEVVQAEQHPASFNPYDSPQGSSSQVFTPLAAPVSTKEAAANRPWGHLAGLSISSPPSSVAPLSSSSGSISHVTQPSLITSPADGHNALRDEVEGLRREMHDLRALALQAGPPPPEYHDP